MSWSSLSCFPPPSVTSETCNHFHGYNQDWMLNALTCTLVVWGDSFKASIKHWYFYFLLSVVAAEEHRGLWHNQVEKWLELYVPCSAAPRLPYNSDAQGLASRWPCGSVQALQGQKSCFSASRQGRVTVQKIVCCDRRDAWLTGLLGIMAAAWDGFWKVQGAFAYLLTIFLVLHWFWFRWGSAWVRHQWDSTCCDKNVKGNEVEVLHDGRLAGRAGNAVLAGATVLLDLNDPDLDAVAANSTVLSPAVTGRSLNCSSISHIHLLLFLLGNLQRKMLY